VWSVQAGSGAAAVSHQEIATAAGTATSNVVTALATPPESPTSPAVLAWTPPLASVPTAPGSAPSPSATLLTCGARSPCQSVSAIPGLPGSLAVSHVDGQSIVASTRTTVAVSRDGGQSFAAIALPANVTAVQSAVPAGSGALWLSVSRRDGTNAVLAARDGSWSDASGGVALLWTHLASLTAVGARYVIAVMPDAGYRCTSANQSAWATRCPRS
jgi:hypothetical protein